MINDPTKSRLMAIFQFDTCLHQMNNQSVNIYKLQSIGKECIQQYHIIELGEIVNLIIRFLNMIF